MDRTDILWADTISDSSPNGKPGFMLGEPDALEDFLSYGRSVMFTKFSGGSYENLPNLFGSVISGDTVSAELLATADVVAFEINAWEPAVSGGWESCDWHFNDGSRSITVHWDESVAADGRPVPRDPHIIANGSITGAAYCSFFGIPASAMQKDHPHLSLEQHVVSFLLFKLRPELDTFSPSFTVKISGVSSTQHQATPDPDAIGILHSNPSSELSTPRKPKKSSASKVRELCESLGVTDAVLPALRVLWKRHREGQAGRNAFEQAMASAFANMDTSQQKALDHAFSALEELRKSGTAQCLFDDSIANTIETSPLEQDVLARSMVRLGFPVAMERFFQGSGGVAGPGQIRMWRPEQDYYPDSAPGLKPLGPWPWLTAVVDYGSYQEFGNIESFRPKPGQQHIWQDSQFSQTCTFEPDPNGVIARCTRERPPTGTGGFGGNCPGGNLYQLNGECLRIPAQTAGGSIKLRGFNFITNSVTVHLRKLNSTFPHEPSTPRIEFKQESVVFGDRVTPVTDSEGKTIVDESVKDWIDVQLPSGHPDQQGVPLPAGIYSVWVSITAPLAEGDTPQVLESNDLLLRIEPHPDVKYSLVSERGRCIKETPGGGDDEIWWDAFVADVVPDDQALVQGKLKFKFDTKHIPFPREQWEDMDSGEDITYSQALITSETFKLNGVKVIAIIGFEVDSEDAAHEQIRGFWEALEKAIGTVVTLGFAAEGSAVGIAELALKAGVLSAKAALSAVLVASVVIAVVMVVGLILWAAWAPADLVALDIITLDALTAFDKTDAHVPLLSETKRRLSYGDDSVTITERPVKKVPSTNDPSKATWFQENQYNTKDSVYILEFSLSRRS